MGIILGLGAAFAFGGADFCARFVAKKIGNFRTSLYMQLMSGLGLSLWLILVENPQVWSWQYLLLTAILAASNTIAGLCLYRAFEVGLLSVVSPIAASYGAISLGLSLLSGQQPTTGQLVGLVMTIGGVVLASSSFRGVELKFFKNEKAGISSSQGAVLALIAALGFGIVFWVLGFVSPVLGGVVPIWEIRLVGIVLVLILARPLHQTVRPPNGSDWVLVSVVGVLDTLAFLCLNFGTRQADSGIVAVLSSLFSGVTILLARVFLKERLASNQWWGIIFILIGVGLISISNS